MFGYTSRRCFGLGAALAATALVAALVPATPAQALIFGQNACYEVGESSEFVRYVATPQGLLTTFRENREFEHPVQTAYTVHGKTTFVEPSPIGILDGASIVGRDAGAVIAFQVDFLGLDFFVKYDCFSEEPSATPTTWFCEQIRVDGGDTEDEVSVPELSPVTLFRVTDPLQEQTCSNFTLPIPE